MKAFLKLLLHAFVSAAVVAAAGSLQSGGAVTSGNVLIPSLIAGALAAVHAALPSPIAPAA